MSATEAVQRPASSGRTVRLWLGLIVILAAAIGLAWIGAGSLRPEVSPTGLEFRTIKAGTGETIGADDAVLLDYVLSTDDGAMLDSSQAHGGPQPLVMAGVFPGFAEAMGKMQEGGQYRFSMPKKLAFGDRPAPQGFTGEKLNFEVQVRKIVRGGAAMMQAAPQAPQAPQQ